jgi:xanthine dehydrogenase molybdenum-binding subunit
MAQAFQYVGRSFPTCDAPQKVCGEEIYVSDIALPRMAFARLVLSAVPHGIVTAVDKSAAEALPGVLGVYEFADAPATPYCRSRIIPDQELSPDDETVFAKHVRFVGDRVAAVVATSARVAEEAASLVRVQYRELPALLTPEAALAPGAVAIHAGGNLLHEYEIEVGRREGGDAAEGGLDAVETTVSTPRIHHAALEPHACVADYSSSGRLTIWTCGQGVYGVRTVIADLFGLTYNNVRVIKAPMGGSFGGKNEYVLEPVTAFLAMRLRRPVKLTIDREQCMIGSAVRPATVSSIRSTARADGRLLDMDVTTTLDAGGYASSTLDYVHHVTRKATKLYGVPHYRHRSRAVCTNTPVAGAARGWGAPEIMTALEIHMDQLAGRLGIDPVLLRLRNMVQPFDMDPVGGLSLGDARVRECLERGAELFDWERRVAALPGEGRYRIGVGVAAGAHKNGMFGGFSESSNMTLKMNEDGSFSLEASLHDPGCGVVTTMKIIAAEVLSVAPRLISAGEADTEVTPFDYGTFGSRVTYVCGACAKAVATEVRDKILQTAARLLQEPLDRLYVEDGVVHSVSDPARIIAYREIASAAGMHHIPPITSTVGYFPSTNPGSYSVQFAEVTVDTLTGLTRVTDFLAVGDVGQAINRRMTEAQFHGAVHMGIGYALTEDLAVDERGRSGVGGFKNYHILNAPDMPDVRVLLIEHEGDEGPFGAKSVGEIATVPTAAAVVNAVNRALGTALTDLPLTPERVMAAWVARGGTVRRAAPGARPAPSCI